MFDIYLLMPYVIYVYVFQEKYENLYTFFYLIFFSELYFATLLFMQMLFKKAKKKINNCYYGVILFFLFRLMGIRGVQTIQLLFMFSFST